MITDTENCNKTRLKDRIAQLDRQQLLSFCSFVSLYGASFYTMRDKMMRNTSDFCHWEVTGIEKMISDFAPDYKGEPEEFFEQLEEKSDFVQYMCANGEISRASCYQRFKLFNFKRWEVVGLSNLLDRYLTEHAD